MNRDLKWKARSTKARVRLVYTLLVASEMKIADRHEYERYQRVLKNKRRSPGKLRFAVKRWVERISELRSSGILSSTDELYEKARVIVETVGDDFELVLPEVVKHQRAFVPRGNGR